MVPVIGGTGPFGGNHAGTDRTLRPAHLAEERTLERRYPAFQDIATPAARGVRRGFNVAFDKSRGIELGELISQDIGLWLRSEGLAPWSKGKPPKFELVSTGERSFRLSFKTPIIKLQKRPVTH